MPMSMYEIRNEYSLADPELYRAADKDNPEALLEGVAMAGLVGVLRQLGDLAEFAAEIFHDLHEEVMATAARGHDLLIRVQQLESEVPSIEKAFLSQTDQSSFFYSAGFDWRTNLRMEQNLVTQGDLPRFIMDSYEECRGPPRLFLLDKFDVTGTGACLKRYTDPSFFKVETSEITSLDVQRENKIRKTKKKGPRWRNRETPEVLPTPHVKLHQLFLEDRVENGVRNPARRVKLKRRLNGFPFDSRTGKSYMEKLLQSPSPEHKVLHDVYVSSSLVMLPTNDHNESALEVVEFGTVNPERESKERKISPSDREKNMPNPSINEPKEIIRDDNICEVSNSYASVVADEISYTVDKLDGENDIPVNGESKTEGTLTGYQSDDIASEIENYMDASSTMGSEMDTDSELQLKSDFTSSLLKTQPSYANGDLHSSSSDSQSTGEPRMYDAWNNLSKNKTSSFSSSGSLSTSAENPHLDKFLSARLPSADIPDIDIVDDISSYQKTTDEDFPVDQHPNPVDFDYNCSNTDAITNQWSDFEQLPSSLLCTSDSIHMLSHSDSEEVRKDRIMGQLEHLAFASDDEHRKISLAVDRPCSPNTLDSKSRSGDHSPPSAAHEHLNDEPNIENLPSIYTVISHKDRSIQMFSDLLHEDDADHEDLSLGKNTASSSNMSNGCSQSIYDAPEMITIEYPIGGKKDGEVSELTEKVCSDCPDIADNGHSSLSTEVPKEEKITDKLDHKDSNILHFSFIMEASHGKELSEASSSMVHNVNADEHYSSTSIHNQCSSENTLLQYAEGPPDWPEDVIDPHDSEVVPQEESTINATSASGTSESHKVVGLHGPEFTDGLFANDSAAMKSCGTQEFLEAIAGPSDKVAGPSDKVQHDRITLYTDPIGLQVDETLVTTDINLLIKYVHDVEQLETADKASPAPAVSDNANKSLDKLIEELTPRSVDSNTEEVEDDSNSLSESHGELGLVEEVGQAEATSPNLSSQSCNNIDNGHLKLEASDNVPGPDLVSNVAHGLDFVDVATIESVQAQSGLDREHESVQQSSPRIHVYDASSSPIDSDNEEIISQSNIRANQLIDEFPDSEVIRLGLSPLFSVNLQQIADHDDHKEDNSSESMFTLVNYPSPPSFYELPRTRNYDNNITGQPKDPLGSIFPPSNVSYETNQINLNELPPLPPLPPVQWRMGKLLQASSITGGEIMKPKSFPVLTFPPLAPTDAINSSLDVIGQSFLQITPEISPEEKNEHGSPSFDANAMDEKFDLQPGIENEMLQFITSTDAVKSSLNETNHSPIHIVLGNAPSSEKVENEPNNEKAENEPNNEKAEHILSSQEVCTMDKKIDLQPDIDNEKRESNTSHDDVSFTSTDAVKSSLNETNHSPIHIVLENAPSSEKVENEPNNEKVENEPNNEKAEHILSSQEVCTMDKKIDLQPDIDNEKRESNTSHDDVSFSLAEMNQSSFHINPVIASEPEQENVQPSTSRSDANALHEPKILPSKVENEKLQLLVPFSVRELPLPAEDEVSHGTRVKLPWPRNPLVDDVAALDKGKLRKVTERVVPEIQKVDERDSLLVQIRNKSFNLKPAMASRPSIRGPRTNLKVAAILEKANQIRQAFAGSDEDDDDNWSDS